jgi:hypothetical protein
MASSEVDQNPAGLVTFYSNLGQRNNSYDRKQGWSVSGTHTGFLEWIAMPFHVKEDATITRIKIAMLHSAGTNGFTMTLTEDDHRLPTGVTKGKWEVTDLPLNRTCCTLKVINVHHGIKVKKGETYWIVAKTDPTNEDTSDVWPYTFNHTKSQDISVRAMPFV